MALTLSRDFPLADRLQMVRVSSKEVDSTRCEDHGKEGQEGMWNAWLEGSLGVANGGGQHLLRWGSG